MLLNERVEGALLASLKPFDKQCIVLINFLHSQFPFYARIRSIGFDHVGSLSELTEVSSDSQPSGSPHFGGRELAHFAQRA